MNVHPAIRHEPDPEHPGWFTWDVTGPARYNNSLGRLLVRRGGDGRGWCRISLTSSRNIPRSSRG